MNTVSEPGRIDLTSPYASLSRAGYGRMSIVQEAASTAPQNNSLIQPQAASTAPQNNSLIQPQDASTSERSSLGIRQDVATTRGGSSYVSVLERGSSDMVSGGSSGDAVQYPCSSRGICPEKEQTDMDYRVMVPTDPNSFKTAEQVRSETLSKRLGYTPINVSYLNPVTRTTLAVPAIDFANKPADPGPPAPTPPAPVLAEDPWYKSPAFIGGSLLLLVAAAAYFINTQQRA